MEDAELTKEIEKTKQQGIAEYSKKFCPIVDGLCITDNCISLKFGIYGTPYCAIIDGLGAIFSTSCGQEL